jgi:hypothetical protein
MPIISDIHSTGIKTKIFFMHSDEYIFSNESPFITHNI